MMRKRVMCPTSVLSDLPVKSDDEFEGIPKLLLDGDPPDVTGLRREKVGGAHTCVCTVHHHHPHRPSKPIFCTSQGCQRSSYSSASAALK